MKLLTISCGLLVVELASLLGWSSFVSSLLSIKCCFLNGGAPSFCCCDSAASKPFVTVESASDNSTRGLLFEGTILEEFSSFLLMSSVHASSSCGIKRSFPSSQTTGCLKKIMHLKMIKPKNKLSLTATNEYMFL